MADHLSGYTWQHMLDIGEAWRQAVLGEITQLALLRAISFHLEQLVPEYPADKELPILIDTLANPEPNELDDVLDWLFSWADQDRRLFIKTF
jgi:hypothetical protein